MTQTSNARIGQLIEHIHTKNNTIKKALASHARGEMSDVELFKQLNQLASQPEPAPLPGYRPAPAMSA